MSRNLSWWALRIGVCVLFFLLTGSMQHSALASHCSCLHNATDKRDGLTYGARGTIQFTNPSLNSGQWTYNRVIVYEGGTVRFIEWGWQKYKGGLGNDFFRGLLAYNNGSGVVNVDLGSPSQTTHTYGLQYDPNSGKYYIYLDGVAVASQAVNFGAGQSTAAGGEVALGSENMGNTLVSDLRYSGLSGGLFYYYSWGGHVNNVDNAPYTNPNYDANGFYSAP